jgi:hypothetical protein
MLIEPDAEYSAPVNLLIAEMIDIDDELVIDPLVKFADPAFKVRLLPLAAIENRLIFPEDAEVSILTDDDNVTGASTATDAAVMLAPRKNDLPIPPI